MLKYCRMIDYKDTNENKRFFTSILRIFVRQCDPIQVIYEEIDKYNTRINDTPENSWTKEYVFKELAVLRTHVSSACQYFTDNVLAGQNEKSLENCKSVQKRIDELVKKERSAVIGEAGENLSDDEDEDDFSDIFPVEINVQPTHKGPREKVSDEGDDFRDLCSEEIFPPTRKGPREEVWDERLARAIRSKYLDRNMNVEEAIKHEADVNNYFFEGDQSNLFWAFENQGPPNDCPSTLQLLIENRAVFKDLDEERGTFRRKACSTPIDTLRLFVYKDYFAHVNENDLMEVMGTCCDRKEIKWVEYLKLFMELLKKILNSKGQIRTLALVLSQVMPGITRTINHYRFPTFRTLLHLVVSNCKGESYTENIKILLDEGAYLYVEDDRHRTPRMVLEECLTIKPSALGREQIKFLWDNEKAQSITHAKEKLDYLEALSENDQGEEGTRFDHLNIDVIKKIVEKVMHPQVTEHT